VLYDDLLGLMQWPQYRNLMFLPFSGFAVRQKLYTRDLYLVLRVLVES
jgi:hypothetical protein